MEEWKELIENPNYSISDLGNLRNNRTNKILKPNIDSDDYCMALINVNGIRKAFKYHRLVMKYFKGESDLDVNHIDTNKRNNAKSNLEYTTKSGNMKHAVKHGLCINSSQKGENHNTSKFNFNTIQEIRELYKTGKYTMRKLAKQFNTSSGYICTIVNNKIRQEI